MKEDAKCIYEALTGKELEEIECKERRIDLKIPGIDIPGRGKVDIDLTVVDAPLEESQIPSLDAYIFHFEVCSGDADEAREYISQLKEKGIPIVNGINRSYGNRKDVLKEDFLQKLAGQDNCKGE